MRVILLITMLLIQESISTVPVLTLYSNYDCTGETFTTNGNVAYLSTHSFEDKARSISGIGLWMLYEDPEFKQRSQFVHTYASSIEDCDSLDSFFWDQVSSLRSAGTDDIYDSTLMLYQDVFQTNDEFLVTKDMDYLSSYNNEATSFTITGNVSWTVYKDPSYEGESMCLIPNLEDGDWTYGIFDLGDFPNNDVTSVKRGCGHEVEHVNEGIIDYNYINEGIEYLN